MKKTLLAIMAMFLEVASVAQEPKVKFQGGLWSGSNGEMAVVGVPAAKLSVMFSASEKTKLEVGLTLIPGLLIDKAGERLGLSAGGTVTIRKDTWKLKPVVGVVLAKGATWQVLPGIGFIF